MIKTLTISRFGLIQLSLLILFVISYLSIAVPSPAKVTGTCSNCHTMHNSQDGTQAAKISPGLGWDGGSLGGTPSGPNKQLLVTTCVGCHSSTTSSTMITVGSSKIPIVFNTTVPPQNPLAGGNFYWVSKPGFGDAYGHNVYGIASTDSKLSDAPGRIDPTCDTNTCHQTLAASPNMDNSFKGGCQGCHTEVAHHDDTKPWYRFLKGHSTGRYVTGIEDPNWEQNPASGHNKYQGAVTGPVPNGTYLSTTHSMSSFCGGCHGAFHKSDFIGGNASPWTRHPTDIKLPETGEYAGYNPATSYSAEAPVAWTDPSNPTRATAVVMCLSCHRPHGSDQPDLLRWDYSTMVAGSGGSGGCFTCHTTKDGN